MKLAYLAMGLKLARAMMRSRGAAGVSRSAGGLTSGIGTAVMAVAAARLVARLLGRR